jgi:F-type H+-transporting ATPase subunit a
MTQTRKILLGAFATWLLLTILAIVAFGSAGRNESFAPEGEFELHPWIDLPGSFDINKAVFYLVVSAILTCASMVYIGNRMQARPNRVQTAVETLYGLMRDNITRGNMDDRMAAKWFPFIGALFLFIWFNNLLGFIPLPTAHHTFSVFGLDIPAFAIYAATANVSVPLVLALTSEERRVRKAWPSP